MDEQWKAVPGYEGWYEASTFGRFRIMQSPGKGARHPYPRVLANLVYQKGYLKQQFGTCGNTRKPWRRYLHQIIYETFHGPIPSGFSINHIDGEKANNRPENLELSTPRQQTAHARSLGLPRSRGGIAWHLTEADVRRIRELYDSGERTYVQLAAEFGVVKGAIGHILKRRTWKYVT